MIIELLEFFFCSNVIIFFDLMYEVCNNYEIKIIIYIELFVGLYVFLILYDIIIKILKFIYFNLI